MDELNFDSKYLANSLNASIKINKLNFGSSGKKFSGFEIHWYNLSPSPEDNNLRPKSSSQNVSKGLPQSGSLGPRTTNLGPKRSS